MVIWPTIASILLPNIGGWAGAVTMLGQVRQPDGKAWYQIIKKPSWTPPNWVFGPAWTTLYSSMGYASYMVYKDCGGITDEAVLPLALYGGQLVLNWTWTPIFFRFHKLGLAFIHIVALDVAAAACTASFFYVNKTTIYFMAPYLAWLTFASCLNYTIWKLNPEYNTKHE
ncbi:translocator protein-like [Plodia interpunctella]|uniref:translocator protein-like n=1 Tax=Plodia interpunctella TaxID=58824 RepID=UPI0023675E9A|nr:translocator protein-like [Plodia interpunctella]